LFARINAVLESAKGHEASRTLTDLESETGVQIIVGVSNEIPRFASFSPFSLVALGPSAALFVNLAEICQKVLH
jgi:hypothetical protein